MGTQAIPQFLQAPTLDLSLQHPRDCYQIVTKFRAKFGVKCCLSVYTGATFISLGERLPMERSKTMTTDRIEELEQMLSKAFAMRTQANKLKLNRQLVFAINSNIRDWKLELINLREKVGA